MQTGNHNLVLIYSPCGSAEEAERLARALLEERLIACANIYESRSLYHWQGTVGDEREFVLVCKTALSRAQAACTMLERLHSYEIPCVMEIQPSSANQAFERWVSGEVQGSGLSATTQPKAVGHSAPPPFVGGQEGSVF
jgi:periplasmic divalent cation tolerance protein